jgi:RNA polymerase sigma-70 factor (ECF subfamily)
LTRRSPASATVRDLPAGPDDGALVGRACAGDQWALEALYKRHARPVMRLSSFLLGRSGDVDDVVQDTFIRAFDRLVDLRDPDRFGTWVLRIAANLSRSRLRRRRLLGSLGLDRGEDDVPLDRLASEGASPEQRAELAAVQRVLDRLPADQRVAWTLRHVEGWSLDETAEAIAVSLATVKRRLSQANAAVSRHIAGGGES